MRAESYMRAEQRAGAGACAARRGTSGLVERRADPGRRLYSSLSPLTSLGARLLTTRVARRLGLRQQGERGGEAVEGTWEMYGRYGEM